MLSLSLSLTHTHALSCSLSRAGSLSLARCPLALLGGNGPSPRTWGSPLCHVTRRRPKTAGPVRALVRLCVNERECVYVCYVYKQISCRTHTCVSHTHTYTHTHTHTHTQDLFLAHGQQRARNCVRHLSTPRRALHLPARIEKLAVCVCVCACACVCVCVCVCKVSRCISKRGLKNVLWCAAVSKETFVHGKTSLLLRHRSLTVACPNPQTQNKTAYKTKEPFCGIPEVCGSVKRDL